ncbi:MAG: GNAT family N-acetyltransferase, partial [Mycobacteriaceae bacterium]
RVANLRLDSLDQLSEHCRRCVFWELSPPSAQQAAAYGQTEFEKEAWISSVLLEWGSCGKTITVDGVPAASAIYAPPNVVPRADLFPTAPVSADAVLLTSLRVEAGFERSGLGRVLVQSVAQDLTGRGVRAIAVFGDSATVGTRPPTCVLPTGFLLSVGFETVRPHRQWPRLRLELRSAIAWKEDVEAALERLLDSVTLTTVGAGVVSPPTGPLG